MTEESPAINAMGPNLVSSSVDDRTASDAINEKSAAGQTQEPPITDHEQERWNSSTINILRYIQCLFTFVVLGVHDGSVGALIPYFEDYYSIKYTVVATIFLSPFAGYTLSAVLINRIHVSHGQFGIAVAAPICKIIAYVVTCVHPPWPVIPVIFILVGFGNGLEDGAWNAWIGGMANGNELMGLLHGAYGLGATIGPLISTSMIAESKAGLGWWTWYYVMVGLSVMELILGFFAFRSANAAYYRTQHPPAPVAAGQKAKSRTAEALRHPVTYLVAAFLFLYVGVEVALGGWLVTFMLRLRRGTDFASGMVATGFWLGITMGRVVLGFITGRIGEKMAVTVYLGLCVVLQVLFWQIDSFVSSAIFIAWLGFFLGPMFPAAIMVATKLLPRRLHVSAIGFVAAFGGSGAAVFPFIVGAIAQSEGVWVLQPFALALIAGVFIIWCILPGGFKKKGLDIAHVRMLTKEKEAATADADLRADESV